MLAGNIHRVGLAGTQQGNGSLSHGSTLEGHTAQDTRTLSTDPVSHSALQGHQHGLCKCSTISLAFSKRDSPRRGSTLLIPERSENAVKRPALLTATAPSAAERGHLRAAGGACGTGRSRRGPGCRFHGSLAAPAWR